MGAIISRGLVLHPILSSDYTFSLAVGVPPCVGPVESAQSPPRVGVRCGCQVCVSGCDNVAIFSMY